MNSTLKCRIYNSEHRINRVIFHEKLLNGSRLNKTRCTVSGEIQISKRGMKKNVRVVMTTVAIAEKSDKSKNAHFNNEI